MICSLISGHNDNPLVFKAFGKQEMIYMIEGRIHYDNTHRVQRNLGILTPMEKRRLYLVA